MEHPPPLPAHSYQAKHFQMCPETSSLLSSLVMDFILPSERSLPQIVALSIVPLLSLHDIETQHCLCKTRKEARTDIPRMNVIRQADVSEAVPNMDGERGETSECCVTLGSVIIMSGSGICICLGLSLWLLDGRPE